MGGQKVVVRVPCCDKGRSIALQTVAGVPGLSSVSLDGAEKDLVVVIGEDIDPYGLMKSLKKKVRCVQLLTVEPVEEKKPDPKPVSESVPCFFQTVPRLCRQEHAIYVCELCNSDPVCVIM